MLLACKSYLGERNQTEGEYAENKAKQSVFPVALHQYALELERTYPRRNFARPPCLASYFSLVVASCRMRVAYISASLDDSHSLGKKMRQCFKPAAGKQKSVFGGKISKYTQR